MEPDEKPVDDQPQPDAPQPSEPQPQAPEVPEPPRSPGLGAPLTKADEQKPRIYKR